MGNLIGEQQKELIQRLSDFCDGEGIFHSGIPQLHFIQYLRRSKPVHTVYRPSLCMVVQGEKVVMLARQKYIYNAKQYLVASFDLPITGEVIDANNQEPYLCIQLDFEPQQMIDIMLETKKSMNKNNTSRPGMVVNQINPDLLESVLRLVRLIDTPKDIPVLAPLMTREILYRLIEGDNGEAVKQLAIAEGPAQRVAKVIYQIKEKYDTHIAIKDLAASINMSSSSLHYHFKKVTKLSPLQYQKQLRLQEARRLIFSSDMDAATASFHVGYESPTQFNREYARLFGLPPMKDFKLNMTSH